MVRSRQVERRAPKRTHYAMSRYGGRPGPSPNQQVAAYKRFKKRGAKSVSTGYANTKRRAYKKYVTVGRLGPSFKKGRRSNSGKFMKYGVTRLYERGGELSAANCPYVGHSYGVRELMSLAVSALFHKLMKIAGMRIISMEDKMPPGCDYTVIMEYKGSLGSVLSQTTPISFSATNTYDEIVELLVGQIYAIYEPSGTGGLFDDVQFTQFRVYGNTSGETAAVLYADDLTFKFDCSSSLALQNRTPADTTGADAGNRWEVTANPIAGKSYEGYGNGSALKVNDNTATIVSRVLNAERLSGIISFDIDTAEVTDAMKAVYKRPPHFTALARVKKSAPAWLKPGEIKNSRLTWKKSMSFKRFLTTMMAHLVENTAENYVPIGNFRIFAFEKKCNTQVAGEQVIKVGYELNCVYRCVLSTKQATTQAKVSVYVPPP